MTLNGLKQFLKALALSCLLCFPLLNAQAQQSTKEVLIGVVPNVSARIIMTNYQPMAEHFQDGLGRKAAIVTSTDFATFHKRVLNGEFDLIVTAPNLGRLAEVDGKWETLAVLEPQIPALLVGLSANANAPLSSLKGKKLALANPSSLVAIAGLNWLKAQGLEQGRDYQILRIANDDSLGLALRSGEAAFAMMSMGEFRAKPAELQKELKIINEFVRVPGFFVMANPKLNAAERSKLLALTNDLTNKPTGQKFFATSGFKGLRRPTEEDRKLLDSYLELTRAGLRPSPN